MNTPRDKDVINRVGAVKAARIFSNVVSPPVMFAILGLAVALWELPSWQGVAWAAFYGFFVSLTPILFVLYLLKTGRIVELHMSDTKERHLPYFLAFLASAFAFGVIVLLDGPNLMRCLTLFNMVELVLLAIINVFTLISFHATAATASMMVVGLVFGWHIAALVVLPFVLALSWVRLYLKRHTPAQVIAGLGLGAISVLGLTLTGCFQG